MSSVSHVVFKGLLAGLTKKKTRKPRMPELRVKEFLYPVTGSRSTFEFPSRVYLSGPNLYCTPEHRVN